MVEQLLVKQESSYAFFTFAVIMQKCCHVFRHELPCIPACCIDRNRDILVSKINFSSRQELNLKTEPVVEPRSVTV